MDDHTTAYAASVTDEAYAATVTDEGDPCTKRFSLRDVKRGQRDKLGNGVEDILWIGRDYAIYRSEKGVYVQFADCTRREEEQRNKFTEICPELCELRYLICQMSSRWELFQMSSRWKFSFVPRTSRPTLYDHTIAQAIMLVMEGKVGPGKQLVRHALDMAVQRVTNDNTVRYFRCCLICWIVWVGLLVGSPLHFQVPALWPYLVAGAFGATGALLSVATRLQALKLRPCNQSYMNYWMGGTRVGIGVLAGPILLLLALTILSDSAKNIVHLPNDLDAFQQMPWQTVGVLSLIAGFAERLVPNLLLRTAGTVESSVGTPVQAARS
jgi:hypothetical protein